MVLWRSWKQWRWYSNVVRASKTGAFSSLIIFYYDRYHRTARDRTDQGFPGFISSTSHSLSEVGLLCPAIAYFATVLEYRRFCLQLGAKPLQTTEWLSLSGECFDLPFVDCCGMGIKDSGGFHTLLLPYLRHRERFTYIFFRNQDTHFKNTQNK